MPDDREYAAGHAFGAIAPEGEQIPAMSAEEIRSAAADMFGGDDPSQLSYADIVRVLTISQYVGDLCIKELGDRGKLERYGDHYVIPSALPDSLFVKNVLTEF